MVDDDEMAAAVGGGVDGGYEGAAGVVTRWLLAGGGQRCGEGEGGGEMAEMVMVLAGAWPKSGRQKGRRRKT
nr:hypothetical protein [Tanacetum cinerariifolium]